jgi:polar amino acid transport system permease protein
MQGFDLLAVLSKADYRALFEHGLETTFVIFAGSWLLGMTVAVLLLAVRMAPSRVAEAVVTAYISYHRNVPTLVQLMLWYFGIASLLPDSLQAWLGDHDAEAVFAIIGLGLCQAAYFSEDMRSGLRAVPSGQAEAARALGHGFVATLRFVLFPQALRNALPALVSHTVSLFKNSSLAMAIGATELTHAVKEVESASFRTFETFLVGTLLYLVCSLLLMGSGALLARRARVAGAH